MLACNYLCKLVPSCSCHWIIIETWKVVCASHVLVLNMYMFIDLLFFWGLCSDCSCMHTGWVRIRISACRMFKQPIQMQWWVMHSRGLQVWWIQWLSRQLWWDWMLWVPFYYYYLSCSWHGPGSVVSIVTGYGLDSPGIESQWGRDFLDLSRLVLVPT
jgi:hypothetical protein